MSGDARSSQSMQHNSEHTDHDALYSKVVSSSPFSASAAHTTSASSIGEQSKRSGKIVKILDKMSYSQSSLSQSVARVISIDKGADTIKPELPAKCFDPAEHFTHVVSTVGAGVEQGAHGTNLAVFSFNSHVSNESSVRLLVSSTVTSIGTSSLEYRELNVPVNQPAPAKPVQLPQRPPPLPLSIQPSLSKLVEPLKSNVNNVISNNASADSQIYSTIDDSIQRDLLHTQDEWNKKLLLDGDNDDEEAIYFQASVSVSSSASLWSPRSQVGEVLR